MSKSGIINELRRQTKADVLMTGILTGEVINTNDPKQQGRLQIFVPSIDFEPSDSIPWAQYCSPFGGVVEDAPRGRDAEVSLGPTAYGMWAIPKVGARVIVMCLDGNPNTRVWMGTLNPLFTNHTLPHGRHLEDPKGPLSTIESPIQPLYNTQQKRFTNEFAPTQGFESQEYLTRGSDRSVAAVPASEIGDRVTFSQKADPEDSGYGQNRVPETEGLDSNIYSMTTPGFHSWSMDDNPASCRVHVRTTTGHQIILDDTNERIVIATAEGKTWIEMDEKGTIDIYSEADVSVRSKSDINLTSDKTVRIAGKEGIHLATAGEIRIHSGEDTHIKADGNLRTLTDGDWLTTATGDVHVTAANVRTKAASIFFEMDLMSIQGGVTEIGGALNVQGTVGVVGNLQASGPISSTTDVLTSTHSLNLHTHTYILPKIPEIPPLQPGITLPQLVPSGTASPPSAAPQPSEAQESEAVLAFFPSRVPQHEPYARVWLDMELTDTDDGTLVLFDGVDLDPDSISEFAYDDASVGKGSPARGITFERNTNWRR